MPIGAINTQQMISNLSRVGASSQAKPAGEGFGEAITDAIGQLNQLQKQADSAAFEVASGQSQDLHSALVTVEEASLALELSLQVRNKLIESYQEIMRMQV
jgi:flagellar hook-basal body complex protein FliE